MPVDQYNQEHVCQLLEVATSEYVYSFTLLKQLSAYMVESQISIPSVVSYLMCTNYKVRLPSGYGWIQWNLSICKRHTWIVMLLSKSPFVERYEPPGLLRLDGKWPDGVTTQHYGSVGSCWFGMPHTSIDT